MTIEFDINHSSVINRMTTHVLMAPFYALGNPARVMPGRVKRQL